MIERPNLNSFPKIKLYDATLRDGQHAVGQKLNQQHYQKYAQLIEECALYALEIGHGNGLSASSYQVGHAEMSDEEMIRAVRPYLKKTLLSTFMLPGWGRCQDLDMAYDQGVDIIRIATHCTEADVSTRYLEYGARKGLIMQGVLLMSHMASTQQLVKQARLMIESGASAVGIYDSAGTYIPEEVSERISALSHAFDVDILFHAHNNLGLAIANSLEALKSGARIIDGCAFGFGAGAGNASLELLAAAIQKYDYNLDIDFNALLDGVEQAKQFLGRAPQNDDLSIVSALAGVFSGFKPKVLKASEMHQISPRELFIELGRRSIVAGQEDLINHVACEIRTKRISTQV